MSKDWVSDIHDMHVHYGFHEKIAGLSHYEKYQLLEFRLKFLKEELQETLYAYHKDEDPEEIVDGLIDLCVVAIGTLDLFEIDSHKAWDEVHRANMSKMVGIKESRPNPLGLPDLTKPEGWVGPSHEGNHGQLSFIFD